MRIFEILLKHTAGRAQSLIHVYCSPKTKIDWSAGWLAGWREIINKLTDSQAASAASQEEKVNFFPHNLHWISRITQAYERLLSAGNKRKRCNQLSINGEERFGRLMRNGSSAERIAIIVNEVKLKVSCDSPRTCINAIVYHSSSSPLDLRRQKLLHKLRFERKVLALDTRFVFFFFFFMRSHACSPFVWTRSEMSTRL